MDITFQLKKMFPSADYIKNGRYVLIWEATILGWLPLSFLLGGVVNIRFVWTHAEYDKIDCATI